MWKTRAIKNRVKYRMSSAIHRWNILGVTQYIWNFSIKRSMVAMWMSRRWFLPTPLKFKLLSWFFFIFLKSWMPWTSPSEHHIHSDLIVCQEIGEKLIYWKENKQWLQISSKPATVVKGPVIHVDFLCHDSNCVPHRAGAKGGLCYCLLAIMVAKVLFYILVHFLLTSIVFFWAL